MFYFYIFIVVILFFLMIFFFIRTIIVLLSMFRKVPYVPVNTRLMKEVFKYIDVGEGDNFVDIGSGDGKVVCWIAKEFPEAKIYKGIEISPTLVLFSKFRKLFSKNRGKIDFKKKNALRFDYSDFNRVYMYLTNEFIAKVMPILQEQLPKGAVVVSPIFEIPQSYSQFGDLTIKEVKIHGKIKKVYIWKKE